MNLGQNLFERVVFRMVLAPSLRGQAVQSFGALDEAAAEIEDTPALDRARKRERPGDFIALHHFRLHEV